MSTMVMEGYGTHDAVHLGKNSDVERLILMTLMGAFAALAAALTAVSHPGAAEIVLCVAVVAGCIGGILWLYRRPVWSVMLDESGIICREKKSHEEKRMNWSDFTAACEVRRGRESYLMLMQEDKDSGDVIRAFQRCAVSGGCMSDGCLCAAMNSITHDRALAMVRQVGGLGMIPGCVRVYAC
ncbi:MAG: hypothetical protein IKK21_11120 [Clostridia bacterium]|nr:hypothetical protein [Clostridia bacterium]